MKRLQWLAASALRALGWPGIAGGVLLVLSAALCFLRVLPLQQQIAGRESAQRLAETPAVAAAPAVAAPAADAAIPPRSELNRQLREIRAIAEQSGLDVQATDYSLAKVDGASLWRYQMIFQLEDDYVSVQRFIGESLNALPNLALSGIDIARSEEEGQVTANLRFAFYFRQE